MAGWGAMAEKQGPGNEEKREGGLTLVSIPTSTKALCVPGARTGNTVREMEWTWSTSQQ